MVIHFNKTLQQALTNINFQEYHELAVHQEEHQVCPIADKKIIDLYGEQMWAVVDLINNKLTNEGKNSQVFNGKFDLYNWINHQPDEVAYFLSETGSNCINFSEFKAPAKFHLWLGRKGFVIGVEQKGMSFDAEKVNNHRIKDNEGAAFEFYRNCRSSIFFDNHQETRIVYLEYLF
tara:strand:+ start:845 stop:1372 length:528 start_codon:yes stop_codon:yes gene_type:complete